MEPHKQQHVEQNYILGIASNKTLNKTLGLASVNNLKPEQNK